MAKVLCTVVSEQVSGNGNFVKTAIPVGIQIETDAWDALARWSADQSGPAGCPALARLLGAGLPASIGLDDLDGLRNDLALVGREMALAGPAADAITGLVSFVDRAIEHVHWWRAKGASTTLRIGFFITGRTSSAGQPSSPPDRSYRYGGSRGKYGGGSD